MYYGRYFRLDTEVSHIERGVAIYRYVPDETICLMFTSNRIAFLLVTDLDAQQVETSWENDLILLLFLDERLTATLNGLMAYGFRPANEEHETHDATALSYFSAFQFAMQRHGLKNLFHPRGSPAMPTENQRKVELFLHFLHDLMEETLIFQMSPLYELFMDRFNANFFARCLAAKARYCYQRAFYLAILKESNGTPRGNVVCAERLRFYGEQYYKAEEAWTDCIRDPRSDKTFHESNGWFEPCDDEMKHVYAPWVPVMLDRSLQSQKDENDKTSSRWFVKRYLWRFPITTAIVHSSFRGLHLLMPRLLFAIAAAWFTLLFIEGTSAWSDYLKKPHSYYCALMCAGIVAASAMAIRRVLPFAQNVFWRALNLSLLVLIFSSVIGRFFMIKRELFDMEFFYFWGTSAVLGMVIQIFVNGENPSDSI